MFTEVSELYRRSRKPRDLLWNTYAARPVAAALLYFLRPLPVTPNQVTFASLFVFVAGVAAMICLQSHLGLIAAVIVLQASYVLDCVDGQLARLRGTSTPVGAHLDFLMDELKAFMLVPAAAIRLHLGPRTGPLVGQLPSWLEASWLYVGLGGLVVIATAISLTTFVRRPEYTGGKTAPVGDVPDAPRRGLIAMIENGGRFVIHYPSYILIIGGANVLEGFLPIYIAINALYAARTFLGMFLKLSRVSG